ncbi:hypothetical protein AMS68_005451 [Peltaster fructicola]|uniref:Fungal lipase-type domain-containing protein n=1 Tax=Peltaster fructicola TaxID=286661 RepID=A0A6H0XYW0_9PEZI|nr:hypothetical protein AMS68_005451 [Peltaster fructicola]
MLLPILLLPLLCFAVDQIPLRDDRQISPELFADLERASRIADIAYCVTSYSTGISKPFNCSSRCEDFPGFELLKAFNTGPALSDSAGFVALDHGREQIVVAFRGTYSIANAIADLTTVPQEYTPYPGQDDGPIDEDACKNCTVHIGFNRAWHNTRDAIMPNLVAAAAIHPTYGTTLVGHSLGGAVAMLAALELYARGFDPSVITFGEPRTGNQALSDYLDTLFDLQHDARRYRRVTHVNDPIPLLPLSEWGFRMHAGEVFISKESLSPDVADLHHCVGDNDPTCIAGQDAPSNDLLSSVKDEIYDIQTEPWGIPSRYKLWQLLFAHRDYFHRIGLCIPGGDPLGGGHDYNDTTVL